MSGLQRRMLDGAAIQIEYRRGHIVRALDERGFRLRIWLSDPHLWDRLTRLETTKVVNGQVVVRCIEPPDHFERQTIAEDEQRTRQAFAQRSQDRLLAQTLSQLSGEDRGSTPGSASR